MVIDQDVTSLCGRHHLQVSVSKLTFEKYSLWTTYQSTVLRVNFSQLGKLIKLPMFAVGGESCRSYYISSGEKNGILPSGNKVVEGCFVYEWLTMRVTTNSVNMTYVRHESPSSSVVRASNRCMEGHGFDSCRGLRFFLCPTLATC